MNSQTLPESDRANNLRKVVSVKAPQEVAWRSEDQILEIVVCAAIAQATRQYDTALAALVGAMTEGGMIDD